jgi:hypothetical protein
VSELFEYGRKYGPTIRTVSILIWYALLSCGDLFASLCLVLKLVYNGNYLLHLHCGVVQGVPKMSPLLLVNYYYKL